MRETQQRAAAAPCAGSRGACSRARAVRLALPLLLALLATASVVGCASSAGGHATEKPFSAAEQSRLTELAAQAMSSYAVATHVSFNADRAVQVTATVAWTAQISIDDVAQEQERVKVICFQSQKALWTSGVPISDALVVVLGPVVDEYGDQTTDAHGTAEFAAGTATGIAWASLDPDSAWTRYDHVYLRTTYTFVA